MPKVFRNFDSRKKVEKWQFSCELGWISRWQMFFSVWNTVLHLSILQFISKRDGEYLDFQWECYRNGILTNLYVFVLFWWDSQWISISTLMQWTFWEAKTIEILCFIRFHILWLCIFKWILVNIRCYLNMNFENEVFGLARFGLSKVYCSMKYIH